ncbi:hypothetical protein FHX64_002642 [Microbacter margulisiae]|uniref:Uncharacterized protein n=1 Tax=Microbacter margulisiae TaxID=1350067 RepID=A0A7W5DSV9_9PORP|nr:hypothetical protein [Microbacter margulisiae]
MLIDHIFIKLKKFSVAGGVVVLYRPYFLKNTNLMGVNPIDLLHD